MLGRDILNTCRVINHDSRDAGSLARVGRTSTGVEVFLNREWLAADVRITTGFVEPHFFAGFSGGPKMVAPGLAGLEHRPHAARRRAHRQPARHLGHHRGEPDSRRRARRGRDGAAALRDRRRAEPRSEDHGGLCRQPVRRAPRGVRAREGHRDAGGARAVRRRGHDQLGLPARPEPLSGGQGHVGRGPDREERRGHHLRRGVPRRAARARLLRGRCWRRSPTRRRCST